MPHRDGLILMLSQTCDPAIVRPNAKARGDESWDAYVWVKDADASVRVINSGADWASGS